MAKRYYLNEEQFESLEHYKRMFELNADKIAKLCEAERDDVVYGFHLGEMHSHLRDCFMEMMKILNKIRDQRIAVGKTDKEDLENEEIK